MATDKTKPPATPTFPPQPAAVVELAIPLVQAQNIVAMLWEHVVDADVAEDYPFHWPGILDLLQFDQLSERAAALYYMVEALHTATDRWEGTPEGKQGS